MVVCFLQLLILVSNTLHFKVRGFEHTAAYIDAPEKYGREPFLSQSFVIFEDFSRNVTYSTSTP